MKRFDIVYSLSRLIPFSRLKNQFRQKYCPCQEIDREGGRLRTAYHELRVKKDFLDENASRLETIFLGSSHVAYGFIPSCFSPTSFNMGSTSQDLFTSYHILKNLLPQLPELKTVLIGYDVFSRGFNVARTSASRVCSANRYLFGVPYHPENYLDGYRITCKRLERARGWTATPNSNGYLYPKSAIRSMSAEQRASKHLRELRREESQLVWLSKSCSLLSRSSRDVDVYFVVFPARRDYMEYLPPKTEIFAELYACASEWNVPVLDFFGDSDFCDEDFLDFDHLNECGARKLTEKLRMRIGREE